MEDKKKVKPKRAKPKNQKQSFFAKIELMPWYWQTLLALAVLVGGGTGALSMITYPDNLVMYAGFVLFALIIWITANIFILMFKK